MRKYYQRRLPEDPSKDYYYIMRETPNTTSLLLEYGFIDNPRDVVKLQNYLLDYVEAVVRAVSNYIGVPYVAPDGSLENTYTVQAGYTLYSIARKFNVTINQLKALNNLASDTLSVGQVLKVPTQESYINYTVQNGDSLWVIANKYETTVDRIKELNGLISNNLSIGQTLIIPS